MARAFGSYPECRRFESTYRYHNGPVVKRLRHGPFTAVTRVRFPSGSPDKKRRRQGAFFIGGPQSPRPQGKYRNRQEKQQTAAVLPAFLFLRDPLQRAHRGAARPPPKPRDRRGSRRPAPGRRRGGGGAPPSLRQAVAFGRAAFRKEGGCPVKNGYSPAGRLCVHPGRSSPFPVSPPPPASLRCKAGGCILRCARRGRAPRL